MIRRELTTKLTALKAPVLCPLVLLVKVH